MTAPARECQPGTESLPERLRVNSCRRSHESEDVAARRRIATDLEAADRIEELTKALTEIDTLATCTGVVDPALHRNMLDNIYRIARRGLAMPLDKSGGAT